MRLVFFGASKYVLPVIEFLTIQYELDLVITTEQSPYDAVPSYCKKNNIPFISVTSLHEEKILSQLQKIKAPVAVLAYFGLIIRPEVIAIFPKGIINIHPSLLPKYRGTTPGQSAILNGDTTSGVSIMLLDREVDHGSILAQQSAPILSTDTADSFYQRFFQLGTTLLQQTLTGYLNGTLSPLPQDHTKATFTKTMTRQSGFIDSEKSVKKEMLSRMIRAYYPWPGIWTRLRLGYGGQAKEKIVKFLPGNKLQVEGKKAVTIKDFLNGYPEARKWLEKFLISNI